MLSRAYLKSRFFGSTFGKSEWVVLGWAQMGILRKLPERVWCAARPGNMGLSGAPLVISFQAHSAPSRPHWPSPISLWTGSTLYLGVNPLFLSRSRHLFLPPFIATFRRGCLHLWSQRFTLAYSFNKFGKPCSPSHIFKWISNSSHSFLSCTLLVYQAGSPLGSLMLLQSLQDDLWCLYVAAAAPLKVFGLQCH